MVEVLELTDEEISGQNLTDNPDIKYRRDRYVSDVHSYKRCAKTKDFLNYCNWLLGTRETCDAKSTTFFDNILRCIRLGNTDKLPNNYKILYKCYQDIIGKASEIMAKSRTDMSKFERYLKYRLGQVTIDDDCNKPYFLNILCKFKKNPDDKSIPKPFREYIYNNLELVTSAANVKLNRKNSLSIFKAERNANLKTKINSKNVRSFTNGYSVFEKWLTKQLNGTGTSDTRFASYIMYYLNHDRNVATYMPNYVKPVCDKFSNKLQDLCNRGGMLVKQSDTVKTPIVDNSDEIISKVKTIRSDEAKHKQECDNTTKHDFNGLIQALKDLGIKEFSIKF